MVLDAGTGRVRLIADPTGLSTQIGAGVQGAVKGAQTAISGAGQQIVTLLTNPLVLGGLAAKVALDFENAFTRIDASSNASAADIAKWKDQVLELGVATGKSPRELADGLFFLASAGLKTSEIMDTLEQSAKASASGFGDVQDIAKLTANVLNAYSDSGIKAGDVTDVLAAAVREGTADTDEFAGAMGRVLPIASAAGVSFDQIAASLASLSNIGLDVNEGTTALRGLLQAIVSPTHQSAEALKELGISTEQLRGVLSEGGLLAALDLLNTKSGGNLDTLRELVPNVRSLTGFLGLTGDQAEHVAQIFDALTNAEGSLDEAFETTQKGPGFALKQVLAELETVGIALGEEILPVLVTALKAIGPVLQLAAKGAQALLIAFVGYKILIALPGLLLAVGSALESMGISAASGAIAQSAVGMSALAAAAGPAAIAIGLLGVAIANSHFDEALGLDDRVAEISELARAAKLAELEGIPFSAALDQIRDAAQAAADGTDDLNPILDELTTHLDQSGKAADNFAGLTRKALREFKAGVVDSVQVSIGQFDNLKDAFKTTPAELARQAALAVKIARQEHRDLRTIFADKGLSEAAKQALANLPADQRRAFVEMGKGAREQFAQDAVKLQRLNNTTFHELTTNSKEIAKPGGHDVGAAFDAGLLKGIVEGSPAVAAAAAAAVRRAIQAAKDEAAIESPSRVMREVGENLMEGLSQGIESRIGKLSDQLRDLVGLIRENIGVGAADQTHAFVRELDALERKFVRLGDKIRTFRDAIRQAFSSIDLAGTLSNALDEFSQAQDQFLIDNQAFQEALASGETGLTAPTAPTAPDLGALLSEQVAQARELAKTLRQLQKAGLSTAGLQDVAALGPEGAIATGQALLNDPALIEQMNANAEDLADILGRTGDALTEEAFGNKVQHLGQEFDDLIGHLQKFISNLQLPALKDETREFIHQIERMNEVLQGLSGAGGNGGGGGGNLRASDVSVTVNVPGGFVGSREELARVVREEFVRIRRNGGDV